MSDEKVPLSGKEKIFLRVPLAKFLSGLIIFLLLCLLVALLWLKLGFCLALLVASL